jgi:hypothetical protein
MNAPNWWTQPPSPRGGGVILSLVGSLAVYLGILAPLVNHRAPAITQLACALFGLPLATAGIAFLLFGQRAVQVIGDPRKPIEWTRWLTVPLVFFALAAFAWLRWRYAA